VPSVLISLLLVLAASAPDPLSPPPYGRPPVEPAKPTVPVVPVPNLAVPKASPPTPVAKPKDVKPLPMPNKPAKAALADKPVKANASPQETAVKIDEPEEDIIAEIPPKSRMRKRNTHKATAPEHDDTGERRGGWTADRYAAVVPPGLTLAALRNQLAAKGSQAPADSPAVPSEHGRGDQTMAEIEKAREALRQETARLEALIRTAGNCGGGGMPIGDGMLPVAVPAATLREASSEQIDSVSKAMKGMKPEQAAALIARLDRGLAAEILRRMKSVDAGAVLGLLKPELAAELATQIAIRKPMYPKDRKETAK
jgi:flagellar motility protein MotE (MotC chaperone)